MASVSLADTFLCRGRPEAVYCLRRFRDLIEAIAQAFPVLTLEQVYGALTFYLAHRQDVDSYLSAQRADFEAKRAAALAADPMFYQKLAASRRTRIAS